MSVNGGISSLIKSKASSLGFDLCGITRSRRLSEYEEPFREWCRSGMNDMMTYLSRNVEKRIDPSLFFPEARSVVVVGMNYFTINLQSEHDLPVISRYALGNDYHRVITGKLKNLLSYIRTIVPETHGKISCDSSPVMEKPWAVEAGLGWQGKNSLVINEKTGSFFFIGILFLNIELEYDLPVKTDRCRDCSLCIDRCPTGAINSNRTIDARKCISNLTIENRNPLDPRTARLFERRVFGCDICQEVCPWNINISPHNHPEFIASEKLISMTRHEWLTLDRERFEELFGKTPVARVGFERFKKNVETILYNSD